MGNGNAIEAKFKGNKDLTLVEFMDDDDNWELIQERLHARPEIFDRIKEHLTSDMSLEEFTDFAMGIDAFDRIKN